MGKEGIATLLLPKNDPKETLQISQPRPKLEIKIQLICEPIIT